MNDGLFYSEERGTWNVIWHGEWYYESKDYEQAENIYFNCCSSEGGGY